MSWRKAWLKCSLYLARTLWIDRLPEVLQGYCWMGQTRGVSAANVSKGSHHGQPWGARKPKPHGFSLMIKTQGMPVVFFFTGKLGAVWKPGINVIAMWLVCSFLGEARYVSPYLIRFQRVKYHLAVGLTTSLTCEPALVQQSPFYQ